MLCVLNSKELYKGKMQIQSEYTVTNINKKMLQEFNLY